MIERYNFVNKKQNEDLKQINIKWPIAGIKKNRKILISLF